jgi:hypothetical protein
MIRKPSHGLDLLVFFFRICQHRNHHSSVNLFIRDRLDDVKNTTEFGFEVVAALLPPRLPIL